MTDHLKRLFNEDLAIAKTGMRYNFDNQGNQVGPGVNIASMDATAELTAGTNPAVDALKLGGG